MREIFWLIVIAAAALLIIALIVRAVSARRRPRFELRALPAGYAGAYQQRMAELQAMFVENPRDAVAGARQLVDDLCSRMGYPSRLSDKERSRDLAAIDRDHGNKFRRAASLRDNASTEDMRRALQSYLDLARQLLERGTDRGAEGRRERPQIAG